MRVAALVHFAMPFRCAGSETVLHELMSAAARAGHETTIWCTNKDAEHYWRGNEPDTMYDGVTVKRVRNVLLGGAEISAWKPDVLVSHHQHVLHAIRVARKIGARSVYLIHNDMDLNQRPLRARPDLVVFNSDWVRESLTRFGVSSRAEMTFHPPVTPERHLVTATNRGDAVTLVNLNAHKGAELFYRLAELEPSRRFVGVVGGHGKQIIRRLKNVTIVEHTPDMRSVWQQTRVLLMPSVYESYGLTAQEAGLNGIPTIANPTPGLVENIGPFGLFADRDKPDEWRYALQRLDRPDEYRHASQYAKDRAAEALTATRDTLNEWVHWIEHAV